MNRIIKITALTAAVVFTAMTIYAQSSELRDLQVISKKLDERQQQLDIRETQLNEKEIRLKALEEDLLKKEAIVNKMMQEIQARLGEIKRIEDENLDKLAKVYASTKAKAAAAIIAKMELDKAVQLFQRMPAMAAGKILTALGTIDPEFGSKVSERLTPERLEFQEKK